MKKFALFTGQLLIVAFLLFVAREAWLGYRQEKDNELFAREGKAISVRIEKILPDKRDWKDYLGYSKYIGFSYQGKSYDLRYLPDSGWVGEGTVVRLLYSSSRDRFLQPSRLLHPDPNVHKSKLIGWSVVGTFSYAHRWLFFFLALSAIVALLVFGMLFNLTGWGLFDFFAGILKWIIGVGLLSYFTWNIFSNYSYFRKIHSGVEQTVRITETEKHSAFNSTHVGSFRFYYYAAYIPDSTAANGTRRIMISGSDYDRYHAGDRLPVYYQASMNEIMSADYSFEMYKWVFLGMIWVIALYIIFSGRKSKTV